MLAEQQKIIQLEKQGNVMENVADIPKLAKPKNRQAQAFAQAAADFEHSKNEELKISRKLAWAIAFTATAICVISIMAFLVALLTRSEPEPTIITVDRSTGASTVLRSVKDVKDHYDDVVNKYWLANYVRAYEGYDWYTISEQFESVKLMSETPVATEYSKRVQAANSPLTMLKDKAKVSAKVTAIAFVGDLAQVRFTTEKINTDGENPDGAPVQKWIATIAFQFTNGLATEQQRFVNPLGFKVISYRVDPEVIK